MGLYTQSPIRKLSHEANDIREDQERIVEAITENKDSITNLDKWFKELNSTIAFFNQLNLGMLWLTCVLCTTTSSMLWMLMCIQCNRLNITGLPSIFSLLKNCLTHSKTFSLLQQTVASNCSLNFSPIFFKPKRLTFTTVDSSESVIRVECDSFMTFVKIIVEFVPPLCAKTF